MDTGYVKLYRKTLTNPISTNLELVGLLSVLLLKANHKANSFFIGTQKISVKPGQFVSSQKKLAIEFGVSRSKMIRLLRVLQDEKIVDIKGYAKYSLFTIIRRHEYQNVNTKGTPNDTTSEHQMDTNKNDKNDNKSRGSKKTTSYIEVDKDNPDEAKKLYKEIMGDGMSERDQYKHATLFELMKTGYKVKASRKAIEKKLETIGEYLMLNDVVGIDGRPLWELGYKAAKNMYLWCEEKNATTTNHMSRYRRFLSDYKQK